MKSLLIVLFAVFCFSSCRKEVVEDTGSDYLQNVKNELSSKLSPDDYRKLDFSKVIVYDDDSSKARFLKVPFGSTVQGSSFVFLQTGRDGRIHDGRVISIMESAPATENQEEHSLNARISISSLTKERVSVERATALLAPPLIMKSYLHTDGKDAAGILYIDLSVLLELPRYQNYYFAEDKRGGGGGEPGYGTDGTNNNAEDTDMVYRKPIRIDFETVEDKKAIDILSYLKCFAAIPDMGATYSMEILVDIPVDNRPDMAFDWKERAPGHTFLKLQKSNGRQTVQQYFGFYPVVGWLSIATSVPVRAKFVDNGSHEFNASLTMGLDGKKFQNVLNLIQRLARFAKYDLDGYNCTDFALQVFNSVRSPEKQLYISKRHIPGVVGGNGTNTPNELYRRLQYMNVYKDPEAKNIRQPGYHVVSGRSNGPCK
ncbi:hypothetical protein V9K67_20800 [Paraflavisolibacter sp. H34]|uniref:hypothetical protein n=1 Tax=Huijunlia imazamoxiresistens TaxID=3127457 RepID=UPI0030183FD0